MKNFKLKLRSKHSILNLNTLLLFSVFATTTIFFPSCNPCAGVVCQNGGVCQNGDCSCPAGYEGNFCEISSRDKFIGNYEVQSVWGANGSEITLDPYMCSITAGPNPNEIIISYMKHQLEPNPSIKFLCTVNGNSLNIVQNANQSIYVNSSNYSGSGSYSAGNPRINFSYVYTDPIDFTVIGTVAQFFPQ
jgi:hypothetical protein